ncbi:MULTISPECIES: Gfo/Idh/MocA family protein [Pseudanabaena]|jgi:biliverdin reductase|uniref:Gfo/Idh/MocA family protein n=1 Tax=Pseudanabaena TaxID=1152 RepID=UPI002478F89A|nr:MULTISPECIES: Gfo/Idh/MocA family oxidoreductase [Pseudanabaena]MEA5486170.1 Gfo/Idh/MocA family oxidoreductase [Pseudanabaena sp. CCNP1317]WGS74396.1 Gfo/Idh/MocA family oxidoreductase [Pseudanabaena galeata CCNP1313]
MTSYAISHQPLRVGIVGSGFVAKLRAEIFSQDPRITLMAIAGNPEKTQEIAQEFAISNVHQYWSELVVRPDIDLVVICNVNRDHGAVVGQALRSGKHVIVEYPLSFNLAEAEELVKLAQQQNLMLHVEHIELLGGVHQLVMEHLAKVGKPFYARYSTKSPQRPVPDKWTYKPDLFGFPLTAAVSRLNRIIVLFGKVRAVSCQLRYRGDHLPHHFTSCVCNAQLQFENGVLADVSYSKGEDFWQPERVMELQGSQGALIFSGDKGKLITADGEMELDAGTTRGLFKKDTENVLSHLFTGTPLYTNHESILHSLAVANAAEKSATTNQIVIL